MNAFLFRVLAFDAATCFGMGLLLAFSAGALAGPLGLPALLLQLAGASLFPVAAFIAWVCARGAPSGQTWVVIAGNVLWVIGSLALFAWLRPTPLGTAFVLAQAAAVGALAVLEAAGLRRQYTVSTGTPNM
jgi:hypothetical protein